MPKIQPKEKYNPTALAKAVLCIRHFPAKMFEVFRSYSLQCIESEAFRQAYIRDTGNQLIDENHVVDDPVNCSPEIAKIADDFNGYIVLKFFEANALMELETLAREAAKDANINRPSRLHIERGTELIKEVDEQNLIKLIKRLLSEFEKTKGVSPDEIIDFWRARADQDLMFTVAKEVYGYE